jgi:hypothetical protein
VVDDTAPEILFNKGYDKEQEHKFNLGETVDFSVSVLDDISDAKNIQTSIFMRDVNSEAYYTFSDFNVKFTYKGEFELYVFAIDESGNYAYEMLMIKVV